MPTLGGYQAKLLVFDKDGVLQDFEYRWATLTRARAAGLVERAEGHVDRAACELLLGLETTGRIAPDGLLACGSGHEATLAAATLLHQGGLAWPRARAIALAAFSEAELLVDFAASTRALPGAIDALKTLAAAGWVLAVATSDSTANARGFLDLHGVEGLFVSVVGADRVVTGKPHPAMFELACREAGCEPGEAIMVGDLELDLTMGRAACAAATIGVTSGVGTAERLGLLADLVVADVAALTLL